MTTAHPLSTHATTAAVDRRRFLQVAGGAALLSATGSAFLTERQACAAPTPSSAAESAATRLYESLTDAQRPILSLPFEHELRHKISANWHVTKPIIRDDFYTDDQRRLIDEIVRNVTSPDGYERLKLQTEDDDGGIGGYSVALFGTPGSGQFEFELTGRHLTLRADGNSVDRVAFGGPIVYGHGETDPKANLFHYQTKQVNEVYRALDPKQSQRALLPTAPAEAAVPLLGDAGQFSGLPLSELSSDQTALVEKTLKTLLAPYRQADVDEVFEILKETGGLQKLHLAFYQQGDLSEDKEWDLWRVEGPGFVWHFRGAPHVHAYINIGRIG